MCSIIFAKAVLFLICLGAFIIYQWKNAQFGKPKVEFKHFNPEKHDDYYIRPFKINIPESELIELKEKLLNTRELPSSIEGVGFSYGTNSEYLKYFLEYWINKYNWKERESFFNKFPQFTTRIAGLNIHYIHVKPNITAAKGKEIIPILLIHGWPTSVTSLYKLIRLLTKPKASYDFVFEVIAPSTPGNGFSEAPLKPGLDYPQIASIYYRLMFLIGHEKYFIHASDTGALIGQSHALLYPENVLGYHSNICQGGAVISFLSWYLSYAYPPLIVEENRLKNYDKGVLEYLEDLSFFFLNLNNPDTFGTGLTDSPIGLAAMVLDRMSSLSNYHMKNRWDGGLESFDKDELLDIIMTYWLTKSITTSMRLAKESLLHKDSVYSKFSILLNEVRVPSGCLWFENEVTFMPAFSLRDTFQRLVSLHYHEEGGRFPALTHPLPLAKDIWEFADVARNMVVNYDDNNILRYLNFIVLLREYYFDL